MDFSKFYNGEDDYDLNVPLPYNGEYYEVSNVVVESNQFDDCLTGFLNYNITFPEKYTEQIVRNFICSNLKKHNELRVLHNVSPVALHVGLMKTARDVAETLAKTFSWYHSGTTYGHNKTPIGENLYKCTFPLGNENMSKAFYNEIYQHNFKVQDFQGRTGYFSQLAERFNLYWN